MHIWRYPDGGIFCAASGTEKTQTNCYPLAQQYVDGATASTLPSPNPSPTGNQSGDTLSLVLLLGAIVATIAIASIIKTETGWGWTWRGRSLKTLGS